MAQQLLNEIDRLILKEELIESCIEANQPLYKWYGPTFKVVEKWAENKSHLLATFRNHPSFLQGK